jgi:hypothetical protein
VWDQNMRKIENRFDMFTLAVLGCIVLVLGLLAG